MRRRHQLPLQNRGVLQKEEMGGEPVNDYPQSGYYDMMKEAITGLVARHGCDHARNIVSMGNHLPEVAGQMYDIIDDIERSRADAMCVDGDVSDMGWF